MAVFEQLVIVQYITIQSATSGTCNGGTGSNQTDCANDGGDWEGTISMDEEEVDYTIDLESISGYGAGVDQNGDLTDDKTIIYIKDQATPKMVNESLESFRSRMARAGF